MVVENVRGAQEWVGAAFYGLEAWMAASPEQRWRMGRSAWNFGSFHLWGDVPALMPVNLKLGTKVSGLNWSNFGKPDYKAEAFNGTAEKRMLDEDGTCRKHGSRSSARKAASATIAKIPLSLSTHIARTYKAKRSESSSARVGPTA